MDGNWGEIEILYSIYNQLRRLKDDLDSKPDNLVGKSELQSEYQNVYRNFLMTFMELEDDEKLSFSEYMLNDLKPKK
jgi:hypothetical protein